MRPRLPGGRDGSPGRQGGHAHPGPAAPDEPVAVAIVFALVSALCYGVSDYLAGVTSRTWDSRVVTAITQLIGVATAAVAVVLFPGDGPAAAPVLWGALSGI